MERRKQEKPQSSLPRIGQRMCKTAVAVFICLIIYYLQGYRGEDMPTEAAITAVICMQPYVRDSREYALNRLTGTLIGAAGGLLLLFLLLLFPALGQNLYGLYALMGFGVLGSLYAAVALRKPDASSLAAIVFLCVVISFPEIEDPLLDVLERIGGVLTGTAVAVGVNVFRLPRRRRRNRVFFLRSGDLAPDRYAQISPAVLFRLNYLLRDGAKICLISRHAPAFFTSQLATVSQNLPMIVMDGAAIYDANENRYLYAEKIPQEDAQRLMERLDRREWSYFLYTIHRQKTCIFHQGSYRKSEREVLNLLRRSPYRSYLQEEIYVPDEIVCVKLIGSDEEIHQLHRELHTLLRGRHLRSSVQPQDACPGVSGLYIYSSRATIREAEKRVMRLLGLEHADLQPEELFLPSGYRTEHDAMHLLTDLTNRYAPIALWPFGGREKDA